MSSRKCKMIHDFNTSYLQLQVKRIPLCLLILAIYGVFVCPFIETLNWHQLMLVFGVGFGMSVVPYLFVVRKQVNRLSNIEASLSGNLALLFFALELLFWLGGAFGVALINYYYFEFPLFMSGAKVIISSLTIGVLSATLNALLLEGVLLERLSLQKNKPQLPSSAFKSMSRKVQVCFIGIVLTSGISMSLLVFKDLNWFYYHVQFLNLEKELKKSLTESEERDIPQKTMMAKKEMMAKPIVRVSFFETLLNKMGYAGQFKIYKSIMLEVIFSFLVVFGFLFLITQQFISNIKQLFQIQTNIFDQFSKDNYEYFVPILRHDEFGLMSDAVNDIVIKLREKKRIKSIFGKYISPQVAKNILNSEREPQLGGEYKSVSILFSDIREYTQISESLPPETLVKMLNEYFTAMVEIVHRHQGVLDKFIGDGLMAFFDCPDGRSEELATQAALEMVEKVKDLKDQWLREGASSFAIGVGVHSGEVLVGNIGSEDRLEFTIIGDNVNITSRLEGLSKTVSAPVVISDQIFKNLTQELKFYFESAGAHNLKGKTSSIQIYKNKVLSNEVEKVS